jgi:sigma-B regulation protein RsbU (phosphoserine phosphatase)
MDQHKLYNTIRSLSEQKFSSDEQLLGYVLENIIQKEEIPIKGGRIWKFDPANGTYRLVRQYGEIQTIDRNFRLRVSDNPIFLQLPRKGTLVATETNRYLWKKGIRLYSATGVGERLSWKGQPVYQYVFAINADYLKDHMAYALNIIGTALTAALKNRRIESKAKLLQADLDKAREIQRSILPAHEIRFFQYDIYGVSVADRIVGGDFFDYLQPPEDHDRLGVVIADAASKGMSAAAQALYVSGALRMGIGFNTKISTLIGRVNQLVNRTFTPEHFVSMVYAEILNSSNGLILYVNAGHSTPIILRAASDEDDRLRATGQILGPFPNEKYRADFTIMRKGDILLLYTDGITEAPDEHRQLFGEQRLVNLLRIHKSKSPREICQYILQEVQTYSRSGEYSDDRTVVVIKKTR